MGNSLEVFHLISACGGEGAERSREGKGLPSGTSHPWPPDPQMAPLFLLTLLPGFLPRRLREDWDLGRWSVTEGLFYYVGRSSIPLSDMVLDPD